MANSMPGVAVMILRAARWCQMAFYFCDEVAFGRRFRVERDGIVDVRGQSLLSSPAIA
ncbi:MAG: hypothetical protein FWD57_12900 [Polyangiaceae bacterium]|nr:hypothetical protein [Polyangiaceae bacterium]